MRQIEESHSFPEYHSYLLRLWRLARAGGQDTRLELVSVQSGQVWHFARPEALLTYLQGAPPAAQSEPDGQTPD
jgi:hypothetical protein